LYDTWFVSSAPASTENQDDDDETTDDQQSYEQQDRLPGDERLARSYDNYHVMTK